MEEKAFTIGIKYTNQSNAYMHTMVYRASMLVAFITNEFMNVYITLQVVCMYYIHVTSTHDGI